MLLFGLKYLALGLAFLAVYALILAARPAGGDWRERFETLRGRLRRSAERAASRGGQGADPGQALRASLLAALAGVLLGFAVGGLGAGGWVLALGLGAGGFTLPGFWQTLRRRRREAALKTQLPDALELIANSLRAGLSLVQALEVTSRETAEPLAGEFAQVSRDVRLGLPPEEALEKLLLRWGNADLELFVVAAQVSRRTGGNLAESSSRIIETVRERVRLQGRIETLTAQGVLSGWVVGLLPVGLLVAMSLLDPELISGFLAHPLGWVMLGGGAVMELAGAVVIRRIVAIDV